METYILENIVETRKFIFFQSANQDKYNNNLVDAQIILIINVPEKFVQKRRLNLNDVKAKHHLLNT